MKNNKLAICVLSVLGVAIVTTAFDRPQEEKANYEYLDQQLSNAKTFTLSVLEEMPEDGYSFKPGEEMRTFSAQAFHIAYSLEWFNARLKSAPIAWEPGDEDRLSKDELIAYTTEQFDAFIQIIHDAEEDGAVGRHDEKGTAVSWTALHTRDG